MKPVLRHKKQMIRLTLFFASLCLIKAVFRACEQSTVFQPMLLNASPDSVKYGTNISFFVYFAHQGEPVHNGSLHIETTAFGHAVYNETFALCDHIQCPIVTGNTSWTRTFQWPTFLAGSYKTTLQLKNVSDTFLCLEHKQVVQWF